MYLMIRYRPDIDGLRAVAVLLVVAYHVGVPGIMAGFIGVDVFFVISGYLITSLLLKELGESGSIDLFGFYGRRIRRLFPALIVTVLSTLALGYYFLTPVGPQQELAESAIASSLFYGNIYFSENTGGYFDTPTDQVPLLHLWSLAVEEQFYLVWPILLMIAVWLASKSSRLLQGKFLLVVTCFLAIASFLFGLFLSWDDPKDAFFLMPARAWQLLAGAILAFLQIKTAFHGRRFIGSALALGGVALLCLSVTLIDESIPYPGFAALLPTLAATALISAHHFNETNIVSRLLSTPVMNLIGRVSYPWYLWHWPLLAISRSYNLGTEDLTRDLCIGAGSFVLAYLTYRYLEKPCSRIKLGGRKNQFRIVRNGAAAALVVISTASALDLSADNLSSSGYYSHLASANTDVPNLREICHLSPPFQSLPPVSDCTGGVNSGPSILLWGDSHADHFSPMLDAFGSKESVAFLHRSFSSCPPFLGAESLVVGGGEDCRKFNEAVVEEISRLKANGLKGVVLSANWQGWIIKTDRGHAVGPAMRKTASFLRELDLQVLVLGPTPALSFPAVECLARREPSYCGIAKVEFQRQSNAVEKQLKEILQLPGVKMARFENVLCREGDCTPVIDETVIYRDQHHITAAAASLLADYTRKELQSLIETK
ncbi:acyltransferase family protein [Marinobacter sp.]|uniref:acyltransferase family protein n=1 Tax=Marinobacter sp. TaxID=50741 RepID=UPI0035C78457